MPCIGVTGSRNKPTNEQVKALFELLQDRASEYEELHHGDCVGADETAHLLAIITGYKVIIHPPEIDRYRAFCEGADEVREVKGYIARNHDIVDETHLLVALPAYPESVARRSGTWATVRYARTHSWPIRIINPNGHVSDDWPA